MATLSPVGVEPSAVCHTVAHRIRLRELRLLEGREPPSQQLPITLLRPDDGSGGGGGERAEDAVGYASVMPVTAESLTTERYLDIMVRGAEAAGMRRELVEELRATPCIPRKPSAEFQRFPVSATGDKRRFSRAELRGHPEHIHYITWCGTVLLHDSVANPEARQGLPALDSVSEASGSAMAMRTPSSFKGRFRDGEDMALYAAVQFYEPRYSEAGCVSRGTTLHSIG